MGKRSIEGDEGASLVKKSKTEESPVLDGDCSACFRTVCARMLVYISPAYSDKPLEGIKEQHLDPLLLRYFEAADGVLISYTNLRVYKPKNAETALGEISGECPFSFVWISVDLLVWSPKRNDVLEGYVTVQSPGHIALLIHDTFNATIKYNDIPATWEFVPVENDESEDAPTLGYWQDKDGQKVGGKLQFTVKRFLNGGRTVLVLGSLLSQEDMSLPQIEEPETAETTKKTGTHQKFEEQAENVIETGTTEPEKEDSESKEGSDSDSDESSDSENTSNTDESSASSDSGSNEDSS